LIRREVREEPARSAGGGTCVEERRIDNGENVRAMAYAVMASDLVKWMQRVDGRVCTVRRIRCRVTTTDTVWVERVRDCDMGWMDV
jgi:hypothetical protein